MPQQAPVLEFPIGFESIMNVDPTYDLPCPKCLPNSLEAFEIELVKWLDLESHACKPVIMAVLENDPSYTDYEHFYRSSIVSVYHPFLHIDDDTVRMSLSCYRIVQTKLIALLTTIDKVVEEAPEDGPYSEAGKRLQNLFMEEDEFQPLILSPDIREFLGLNR
ncbi:uncharacterized protein LOC134682917 isoform X2 [Mytilus trossulus]|uniref:uncharacterized protein LOC134682917 isoform X2 n=1 Tax=Mytilus trossulus TaxID=6551 RepID=UPI003005312B